ncbi:MAG: efflux RND transporter periplasmic adaptor subunit [Gammaproteobacteria bacterium]|nr:efflux RND transporter periplasmic adaptor subunit [Gammaproteobacteria bacterium]
MKLKKKFVWVGLIALIFCFYVLRHHRDVLNPNQNAVIVEVAKVKQASIPLEAQAIGTLVAAKNVQIAPEITGQVTQILFHDGEFVKQGTPLIQLNNAIYKAKLDSAIADHQLSETTFERIKVLANKGIISRQDLEKVSANLKEKKAAKEESQAMLDKMLLVAPFDGMVGKSLVSPGDYVSAGQALVSLTDTHHLHVEYNISEKYLASLKKGQSIQLTTSAYPGKTFAGEVAFIAPTINTQDRTISIYAEVPNEDEKLTAGLFVNVTHSLGAEDNVLLIPATSLIATIDGHEVMKVVDGKAVTVPVEIGQRTLNNVQILQGLVRDDSVVTAGQQKIHDGVNVTVKA